MICNASSHILLAYQQLLNSLYWYRSKCKYNFASKFQLISRAWIVCSVKAWAIICLVFFRALVYSIGENIENVHCFDRYWIIILTQFACIFVIRKHSVVHFIYFGDFFDISGVFLLLINKSIWFWSLHFWSEYKGFQRCTKRIISFYGLLILAS